MSRVTKGLLRVVFEVFSLMLVAVLAFGAAALNELLSVETGSPDALCPNLQQTTEAVHARLGMVKSEQPGWRARYTLGHAPGTGQGDFIRLELFDPDQRLQLARELPVGNASCTTLAQSIAIVLSSYFESLAPSESTDQSKGAEGQNPTSVPSPNASAHAAPQTRQPAQPVASERQPANRSPIIGASARAAPQTRQPAQPVAPEHQSANRSPTTAETTPTRGTRHAFAAGLSVPFSAYGRALTLAYAGSPSGHTEYGLLLALPLEAPRVAAGSGSVEMWSARARLWYGLRSFFDPISVTAGPSFSVGLDSAEASNLDQPRRQQRLVMALGLLLDSTFWMHSLLGVGLQAGVDLGDRVISRRFVVQDPHGEPEQEVHSSRWVNGFAGAALKLSLPN